VDTKKLHPQNIQAHVNTIFFTKDQAEETTKTEQVQEVPAKTSFL
jgi:hypothetical protein